MSDPYAFENTIYSKNNGVALLTLNYPEYMNSLGGDMVEGWLAALDDAETDSYTHLTMPTNREV